MRSAEGYFLACLFSFYVHILAFYEIFIHVNLFLDWYLRMTVDELFL